MVLHMKSRTRTIVGWLNEPLTSGLAAGDLRTEAAEMARVRSALDARDARIAAAIATATRRDPAEAVREATGCSRAEAKRRARRGAVLEQMPNAAEALSDGRITAEHVDALAGAAESTSPQAVDADTSLLDAIVDTPADLARHRTAKWTRLHQDDDDVQAAHERARAARSLRIFRTDDRMIRAIAQGDLITGAQIEAVINDMATKLHTANGGRDNPNHELTWSQYRYDALLVLLGIEPVPPPPAHDDTCAGNPVPAGEAGDLFGATGAAAVDGAGAMAAGTSPARGRSGGAPPCGADPYPVPEGIPVGANGGAAPVSAPRAAPEAANDDGNVDAGRGGGRGTPVLEPVGAVAASLFGEAEGAVLDGDDPVIGAHALMEGVPGTVDSLPGSPGVPDLPGVAPVGGSDHEATHSVQSGLLDTPEGVPGGEASQVVDDADLPKEGASHPRTNGSVRRGCVCGTAGTAGTLSKRHKIVVLAQLDALNGEDPDSGGHIPGTGPVSRKELERIGCTADLYGLLFDTRGQPLWLGRRRRSASDAQWKALLARDGGCVLCGTSPQHCYAHHIVPWQHGGHSNIDNLALVCHRDHNKIHDRDLFLKHHPDGKWTTHPAKEAVP